MNVEGVTGNERRRKEWRYLGIKNTEIAEVVWNNLSEEIHGISLHDNFGNVTRLHNTLVVLFSMHPSTKSELLNENLTCFWHQHGDFRTDHLLSKHFIIMSCLQCFLSHIIITTVLFENNNNYTWFLRCNIN